MNVAGAYFGKLPEGKVGNKELTLSSTKIYRKHLRSGQVVQNPGDIIIFGNVNQGAEVNAGGKCDNIWKSVWYSQSRYNKQEKMSS